jgi:uncharacterized protein (TIGR02145 family)
VVWSTSPNPTIPQNILFYTKTVDGTGTGAFPSNLTRLTPNTTYYVRAYAENLAGFGYGEERSFKTLELPSLSLTKICNVTQTTASISAEVTSEGGTAVTSRGVVWSSISRGQIIPELTIALATKTNVGKGTGEFISILSGLTPDKDYILRTYATSANGTAYGDQLAIRTLANKSNSNDSNSNDFKVICGLDIPQGWMYYRTISNSLWPSYCGSNSIAIEIVNTQNLPVGTQLSICYKSEVPSGWRVVRTESETCDEWITSENGVNRFWDCCSGNGGTAPIGFFPNDRLRKIIIKEEGSEWDKGFASCSGITTVEDIDGNTYNTVLIGTQCWMQSNLKVSKYRNGDIIPKVFDSQIWQKATSGFYTYYESSFCNLLIYGNLYNWYAVNDVRGLCPTGWHVPSKDEWDKLVSHLGGELVAGGKLKSVTGWNVPNTGATNESGFTGLPGGYRDTVGSFHLIRSLAFFWSASENDFTAWSRYLSYSNGLVLRYNSFESFGASVRCLRD